MQSFSEEGESGMSNRVHVVTWKSQYEPRTEGIIGVFSDEIKANEIYDVLDSYGDKDKTYYLDQYELDEVKKESK